MRKSLFPLFNHGLLFTILLFMSHCSFCDAEVVEIKIHTLDLRICPKCFSSFFPARQTTAFRGELSDKTRELWLKAMKQKALMASPASATCIDHGEPLVQGKLPDYGYEGLVATCCDMLHLTPELTVRLLEHTLEHPFQAPTKQGKHHFFFIRLLDKLISKGMGEQAPEEDPLDLIQYNLYFKPILETSNPKSDDN